MGSKHITRKEYISSFSYKNNIGFQSYLIKGGVRVVPHQRWMHKRLLHMSSSGVLGLVANSAAFSTSLIIFTVTQGKQNQLTESFKIHHQLQVMLTNNSLILLEFMGKINIKRFRKFRTLSLLLFVSTQNFQSIPGFLGILPNSFLWAKSSEFTLSQFF